tara:strand:- start:11426 stop:24883 length:13458 start_codon:yes stop_codon:yes gene_type:complete
MNFGGSGDAYQGWEGTDQDISKCEYMTCLHPLAKNFLHAQGATDGPRFLSLNVIEKIFGDNSDFTSINQGMCYFDFTDDPIGFIDVPSLWGNSNKKNHPYGNWDKSFTNKWQSDGFPGSGWPYIYMEGNTYYTQYSDDVDMEVLHMDSGYGVLTDGLWGGSLVMWDEAYYYAQVAESVGGGTPPIADTDRNYIELANVSIGNPDQGAGFLSTSTQELAEETTSGAGPAFEKDGTHLITKYRHGPHTSGPLSTDTDDFSNTGYMHQWYFNNTADRIDFNENLQKVDFSYTGFSLNFKSDWFSMVGRYIHGHPEPTDFQDIYGGYDFKYFNPSYMAQGLPVLPLGKNLKLHYQNFNPLGSGNFNSFLSQERRDFDYPGSGFPYGFSKSVEEVWRDKGLKVQACATQDPFANCTIWWHNNEFISQNDGTFEYNTDVQAREETINTGTGLVNRTIRYCEGVDQNMEGGHSPKMSWPHANSSQNNYNFDGGLNIELGLTFAWTDFETLDIFLSEVAERGGPSWSNYEPQITSGFRYKVDELHSLNYGNLCDNTADAYNHGGSQVGCGTDGTMVTSGWSDLFNPGGLADLNDYLPYVSLRFIYRFEPSELFDRNLFCNPFNDYIIEGVDLYEDENESSSGAECDTNLISLYNPGCNYKDYLELVYGSEKVKKSIEKYHEITPYLDPNSQQNAISGDWYDLNQDYFQNPSGNPTGKYYGFPLSVSFEMHNPNLIQADSGQDLPSDVDTNLYSSGLDSNQLWKNGTPVDGGSNISYTHEVGAQGDELYTRNIHTQKKLTPINLTLVNNHPDYGCNFFDFEETIYDDILLSVFEPFDDINYEYITGYNCEDGSYCRKHLHYSNSEESILVGLNASGDEADEYINNSSFYGSEKTYTFDSPWPTDFNVIPQIRLIVEDSECGGDNTSHGGFRVYFNGEDLTNSFSTSVGAQNLPLTDDFGLCQGYETTGRENVPFVYTSGFTYYDNKALQFRNFDEPSALINGTNELRIEAKGSVIVRKVEILINQNIPGDIQPISICDDGSRCGIQQRDTFYKCPTQMGVTEYYADLNQCHSQTSCSPANVPCRTVDGLNIMNTVNGWGLIYDNSLSVDIWGEGDEWVQRCWAAGHCNNGYQGGGTFSLTEDGLTTYEYKIAADVNASTNILAPRDRISNVITTTPTTLYDDYITDLMTVDTLLDLNFNPNNLNSQNITDKTQTNGDFTIKVNNPEMYSLLGESTYVDGVSHLGSNYKSLLFIPLNTSYNNQRIGGTFIMGNVDFGRVNHNNKFSFDYWLQNNWSSDYPNGVEANYTNTSYTKYHLCLFQNKNKKMPIFAVGTKQDKLYIWNEWGTENLQLNDIELISSANGEPIDVGDGYDVPFKNIRIIFTPTGNATEYSIYVNDVLSYSSVLPFIFPSDTRWAIGGVPLTSEERTEVGTSNGEINGKFNFSGKISGFVSKTHRFSNEDFRLQGFRDSDNKCCEEGLPNCIESLQTRFKLNNFYKAANNLLADVTDGTPYAGHNHNAHSTSTTSDSGPNTPTTLVGGTGNIGILTGGDSSQGIRFGFKFKVGDNFQSADNLDDVVLRKNTEYTISTHIYIPQSIEISPEVQGCLDGNLEYEPPGGYPSNCGQMGWTGDGRTLHTVLQSPIPTDWNYLYCEDSDGNQLCTYADGAPTCTSPEQEAMCALGPGLQAKEYHYSDMDDRVLVGSWSGDYMDLLPPEDQGSSGYNLLTSGILPEFGITNSTPAHLSEGHWGKWQRVSFTFKTGDQNQFGDNIHLVIGLNGDKAHGGLTSKNKIGYSNSDQFIYTFGAQLEEGNQLGFYNPIISLDELGITVPQGQYLTFMDMNVLNSPLQVCEGDSWLIDSNKGFGSQTYDITITEQPTDSNGKHTTTELLSEELLEYNGYNDPARYFVDDLYRADTQLVYKITRDFRDFDWTYSLPPTVNSSPIPIRIKGANIPKLQELRINDVGVKPQIGVQLRENEQQIIEYNNIGQTIINGGILDISYTSLTYPNSNIDDRTGVKAVGQIDFSTFELGSQTPPIFIKVGDKRISNDFETIPSINADEEVLPVWEQIVQSINQYVNEEDGISRYRAYYDPSSDTNPDSNLKKIIVEANYVGEEYNGELSWTLSDEYVVQGSLGARQPRFISLQNGKKYPIVHLYEDFGHIDFNILASDVDAMAGIFFQVTTDKPQHFNAYISEYEMVTNPLGDTSNIGGFDTPNIITDSPVEGAGESIATAKVTIETFGGSSDLFTSNNPSDVIGDWDLNNINSPHDGIFPYYVDTFTFELYDNAESMSQDQPSPFPGVHAISHKFKAVVGEFYRYSFKVRREDRGVIMVSLANPYDYASNDGNSAMWNFSGQRGAETVFNLDTLTVTERLAMDSVSGDTIPTNNTYTMEELPDGYIFIEGTVLCDGNPQSYRGHQPIPVGTELNQDAEFFIFLGEESTQPLDYGIQSDGNGELKTSPIYNAVHGTLGVTVSNLSIINNEYESGLIPNYVGDTRIVLRTMDETTMTDLTEFVIRTHPVNDKPVVTAASDTEIYLNNPLYPTDINIELETADVENVDGTRELDLLSFDIIDSNYCQQVSDTIELFEETEVEYNGEGYSCTDMRFCTTLCYEPLGKSKQETEMSCSFASFLGRSIISTADYVACEQSRQDKDNDRDETEFTKSIEFKSGDNLPNFLNETKVDDFRLTLETEDDTDNLDRIKKYVHIVPQDNITGSFSARIGIKDDGVNETGELTQIRTGYSVVDIDIAGVSTDGPQGQIFSLETATFGIIPDTFQYFAKGNDIRPSIPTNIQKDFSFTIYQYEREDEKVISYCDVMPNTFINEFGECCSSNPISHNYEDYFNHSKKYYYKEEYIDEINLLFSYFRKDEPGTKFCDAFVDNVNFKFVGSRDSNNQGGYLTPNVEINELDHVVSYKLEIVDLVENYYSIPDGEYWWNELWEDDWINTWSRLKQEGFETEGDNFYFNKILYEAGPFTHDANNLLKIIEEGFIYRFDYPSIFKVSVYATDTYGFIGETFEIVDARDIIKLNQTVEGRYNPWQGWNILGQSIPENKEQSINTLDKDKRPSLGLWYYEELIGNKQKDWYSLHSDSYKNLEGNFTGSFATKYNSDLEKVEKNNNIGFYPGKVHNELAFSNNFRNAEGKVTEENFNQNIILMNSLDYLEYQDFITSEQTTVQNSYIVDNDKSFSNLRQGVWTEDNKILNTETIKCSEQFNPSKIIKNYWTLERLPLMEVINDRTLCTLTEDERLSSIYNDVLNPYEFPNLIEESYFSTYNFTTIGLQNLFNNEDECRPYCHIKDKHLRDGNDNWKEILNLNLFEQLEHSNLTTPCDYQGWERVWNIYYFYYGSFFNNLNLYPDFWSESNSWYGQYWNSYTTTFRCLLNGQNYSRLLENSPFSLSDLTIANQDSAAQEVLELTSQARQECEDNCLIEYDTYVNEPEVKYCQTVDDIIDADPVDNRVTTWLLDYLSDSEFDSEIRKQPTLSQAKIFKNDEKIKTDRIFSIFLQKATGENNTEAAEIEIEKILADGSVEVIKKVVKYNNIGELDFLSMKDSNDTSIYNLEDDNIYPLGSAYDSYHPDYPLVIPMWSYYQLPEKWNRFLVRVQFDETDIGYRFNIRPGESINHTVIMGQSAKINIANAQVETIEPYKELIKPIQETFISSLVKPYDFIPDVDIRSVGSAGGSKSVMYKYYDEDLQPGAYRETTAPVKAQLFFYIRDAYEKDVFASKQIFEYPNNSLYISFLDWGDGSKLEFDKEPYELTDNKTLDHIYEESGVYEIKGEMFNVARNLDNEVLGIGEFKEFVLRINISVDYEIENEFKQLGGVGYSFIPYKDTAPIISGISNKSFYFKKLKRTLGYIENNDGETIKVKSSFKSWTDEYKTELALAHIDDSIIGPKLSAMTGSIAVESNKVDETDEIVLTNEGAFCSFENNQYRCNMIDSPNNGVLYDTIEDCSDECNTTIMSTNVRGFFEGVVDANTGELVGDNKNYTDYDGSTKTNTIKPKIINKGSGTNFAELGEWVGNADFGQLRYFDTPIDMWEFLGVDSDNESNHPNNPQSMLYWNNIIPNNVSITDREGISKERSTTIDSEGHYLIQFYSLPESGLSYDVVFENWSVYQSEGWVAPLYTYNNGSQVLEQVDTTDLIYNANNVCDFSVGDYEWIYSHCFGNTDYQLNRFYYFQASQTAVDNVTFDKGNFRLWKCNPGGTHEECEYHLQFGDYNAYTECTEAKCFDGISIEVDYLINDKIIDIDESSPQLWNVKNQYNTNYYYPILPKLNKLGKFEEEGLGLQSQIKNYGININDVLNPIYWSQPIDDLILTNTIDEGVNKVTATYHSEGGWTWEQTIVDENLPFGETFTGMITENQDWILTCPAGQCVPSGGENIYYNNIVGKIIIRDEDDGRTTQFKLQKVSLYGQKQKWDEDDEKSSVTLDVVPVEYVGNSLLNLDVSSIEDGSLINKGIENSSGVTFEDFTVSFDEKTKKPKKQKPKPDLKTEKGKKRGQY